MARGIDLLNGKACTNQLLIRPDGLLIVAGSSSGFVHLEVQKITLAAFLCRITFQQHMLFPPHKCQAFVVSLG